MSDETEKQDGEETKPDPKLEPVRVIFATNVRLGGKPSSYSASVADLILERIANGESLLRISHEEGMPSRWTWYRWLDDHEELRTKYARAKELTADCFNDLITETIKLANPLNANAVRVQVDALKWQAGKLKPKSYGDKVALTDADGKNLPVPYFTVYAGKVEE